MAYAQIPKNLNEIEPRPFLGLTIRQLMTITVAAAIGMPLYITTRSIAGSTIASVLMLFISMPIIYFGLYTKNGLKPEQILKNYLNFKKKSPIRTYQTTYYRDREEDTLCQD